MRQEGKVRSDYQQWLEQQYDQDVAKALLSRAARVEKYYGDLDRNYDSDRLEGLIGSLRYSPQDERRRKPNPSRISFEGNIRSNINAFRAAVDQYRRFRAEDPDADADSAEFATQAVAAVQGGEDDGGQKIHLDRDLQVALRRAIDLLEPGLRITDGGAPRQVESGPIDITARDAAGATVVILLKAGAGGQRAVTQILSFMGDVQAEEPNTSVRGVLVASSYDRKGLAVARMAPSLTLRRYEVSFRFLPLEE
ncbi:MAG: endonuclease NucS domain-containing protein [Caulobacteraceae bacterium]